GRLPGARDFELIEPSVVEPSEPPRDLRVEPALGGGTGFEPETPIPIRSRRDRDAVGDLEGIGEPLAIRDDVELEAIATLEPAVDGCHEVPIALPAAGEPGHQAQLVLPKALADVQRPDRPLRPRLPHVTEPRDLNCRTRHETDGWIERLAETLVAERDVPEIVRVGKRNARSAAVGSEVITARCEGPCPEQEILVTTKLRRLIDQVGSDHPASRATDRVAGGGEEPDGRLA